jgi:hypothetical protein
MKATAIAVGIGMSMAVAGLILELLTSWVTFDIVSCATGTPHCTLAQSSFDITTGTHAGMAVIAAGAVLVVIGLARSQTRTDRGPRAATRMRSATIRGTHHQHEKRLAKPVLKRRTIRELVHWTSKMMMQVIG